MNAAEHGNQYRPDRRVGIRITASDARLSVGITDEGGRTVPFSAPPDLESKLAGDESPRGWGLFLIRSMVDEVHDDCDGTRHTLELVVNLKGSEADVHTSV